ncbi:MAG: hypothetical protein D6830_06025 [Ignavibacteria bacterium]|nr:MAG: hypothetical protein D6830_06025 [Ignavibacteria bacterium]
MDCKISLTLAPPLKKSFFDFTIHTINNSERFDTDKSISDAVAIIEQSKYLKLVALNFHIGTNIKSIKPYRKAIEYTYGIYKRLYRKGIKLNIIDIGGGFGCSNINTLNLNDVASTYLFNKSPSNNRTGGDYLIDDIANTIAVLNNKLEEEKIPVPIIYAEPGRWLTASSQVLLLRVLNVEDGKGDKIYCDGGAMNISPLLLAEKHRVENISAVKKEKVKNYDIYGKLPMPLDVVAKGVTLPITNKNDILAVWDTGAYFYSLSNNFGGSRPAFAAINDGKVLYYKPKETAEEFINSFKEKDD